MSNDSTSKLSRRRVFAGAGTVGALAAAAAVLPLSREAAVEASRTTGQPSATPDADGRYQLTEHVMRYYQTAKV